MLTQSSAKITLLEGKFYVTNDIEMAQSNVTLIRPVNQEMPHDDTISVVKGIQ